MGRKNNLKKERRLHRKEQMMLARRLKNILIAIYRRSMVIRFDQRQFEERINIRKYQRRYVDYARRHVDKKQRAN